MNGLKTLSAERVSDLKMTEAGITCPEKVSRDDILQWAPYHQRSFQNITSYTQLRVVETNNFILRFDIVDNLWAMCIKDVFTLDIDIKDGISREQAIANVQKYSDYWHMKGFDLLWAVVSTDHGVHFHLLSETLEGASERALGMAVELCSDKFYIQFNRMNGFCMRVGPKTVKFNQATQQRDPVPKETVVQQFVGKPCVGETCTIGYGKANLYVVAVLDLYYELIAYFTRSYRERYDELMAPHLRFDERKIINWGGIQYRYESIPPLQFLEETTAYVKQLLLKTGFDLNGEYKVPLPTYGHLEEYVPFLSKNTRYQCARSTVEEINRKAVQLIDGLWKDNCVEQIITVGGIDQPDPADFKMRPRKVSRNPNGRSYPFVFGIDLTSYMVFIQVSDLLMIDWDVKDGFPKESAGIVAEKYLKNEESLPAGERISQQPLLLKMYETDHGQHAYCVSDYLPYNEVPVQGQWVSRAITMMMRTCVDPWYIAFVKTRGFSIRVGPKMLEKRRQVGETPVFKSAEEIAAQFVQREGIAVPGQPARVRYLGRGVVNPYLDALTTMILELQQHCLRVPNVASRLVNDSENLAVELGEHAKSYYDQHVRPLQDPAYPQYYERVGQWANLVFRCPS